MTIYYSRIALFKTVPIAKDNAMTVVQSFSESDGYVMSREPGDCAITVSLGSIVREVFVDNVSCAEVKGPHIDRQHVAERPAIDDKARGLVKK